MKNHLPQSLSTLVMVMSMTAVQATTLYWDPNGTATTAAAVTGAWNGTNAFWNTNSAGGAGTFTGATTAADDLIFSSAANLTTGTVTASGTRLARSVTFEDNIVITLAGPVTVGGSGGQPGIFVNSTKSTATTVSGQIIFASNATLRSGGAALTCSGGFNLGANTLGLNIAGAGRISITAPITGTGAVTVSGTGTGDWDAAAAGEHTYSGGTTLNPGSTVAVGSTSSGPAGSPATGSFGTGNLTLNGGQMRSGTGASVTIGNPITLAGDFGFYNAASEKTLVLSGPMTITGASRTLTSTVGNTVVGTTVVFSGPIDDGGNALGITKAGTGNVSFIGNNTYTGDTIVNAGSLSIGSTNSLPGWNTNGRFSIASGATLAVQNGVLDSEVATLLGTSNLAAGARLGFDTAAGNRSAAVNLADTSQGLLDITKVGPNSLILSGINTYSGLTTVASGTLQFATPGSLYNGNSANWTPANLTVSNAATLALSVGGASGFSTAQAGTLLASLSTINNNGLRAGSNFGIDTTSAPGDVTFSQALTDSTGTGGGALGFIKSGTGTLILDQANTHTGATTVTNGTLTLSGNRTAIAGTITVGNTPSQTGILNISNGNFIANTTFVGSGDSTVSGIINQTSGSLTLTGGGQLLVANGGLGNAIGTASFGTYNLSGGTLTGTAAAARGVILGVNNGCTGTFNVSGTGNLAMGSSNMQVGRSDSSNLVGSSGVFTQSGGTAAIGNLTIAGGGASHNGTSGIVSLTGGTLSVANLSQMGSGVSCTAQMTVGGTAVVTLPAFPTARGAGSTATLTLDGGVLIPAAPNTTFMGSLTNAYLTANGANFNVPVGRDITIAQPLENAPSQAGTLTKTGAGVLTLTGANTHSGATTVAAGTLTLAETGTLAGTSGLSVAGGARFNYLPPGPGTLNLGTSGSLTLANNCTLGTTFDSTIAAPGAATASGVVNLVVSGAYSPGTPHTLLTATSGLTAGGATYRFLNPTDYTFATLVSDTAVQITPAAATPLSDAYWTGGLAGSNRIWAASNGSTASNWASTGTGTPTPLVPGPSATLNFNDNSPAPGNLLDMTLGSDMAIGGMTVTSANNLILLKDGVSALTISSSGITVNAGAGSVTLNPDITLGISQTWLNNSSNPLTLGGAVSSTGFNTLTIDGTGATTFANFLGGNGGLNVLAGNTTLTSASPTVAQTWTNDSTTPLTIGTLNNGNALLTIGGLGITNIANLTGGNGGITVSSATTNVASATLQASQTWSSNSFDTGLNIGNVDTNGYGLTLGGTGFSQVTGSISGSGTLTKSGTGTLTLNTANTHSGATVVNGGTLEIGNANALGTTASGTTQSGASEIRLAGGLTIAEPISINGGGISNQGTIRNITGDNTWSSTVTQAAQSRINSDEGTLTLSAPTAVASNNFAFLVLGGAGNINIPGTLALGTGGLAKDGTGTVTLSGANAYGGATKIDSGTLIVAGTNPATGAITAGNSAVNPNATINILNGATLTGSTVSSGTVSGSSGAINLTGGNLLLSAQETIDTISFGVANDSYGAFKMTSGTFTQSRLMFGGTGGSSGTGAIGVGHISGGTVNTNGWFILARAGASTGILTVTGGVINHANASQAIAIGLAGSGRAELNVAGGLIDNTGRNVTFTGGTGGTFNWTGTGLLNLNSGALITDAIVYNANVASAAASSYVNFNGGTLKAATSSTSFLPAFTSSGAGINRVIVNGPFGSFAGGAVIDTNGFDNTIGADLLAASGNGVSSLTIDDGGVGYIGAPAVRILDDGLPSTATAYAVIGTDSTDAPTFGKVISVVITNPGVITGTPSVSLVGGGGFGAMVSVAATAPNTSGGLTKTGEGKLNLNGSSTYTGVTNVNEGSIGGIGSITSPLVVAAGAAVAPGASAGTFTTGATTISGSYVCEIDGATADKLVVNGALNIAAATLDLDVLAGGATQEAYIIASYTGSTPAPFLAVVDPIPGYDLTYNYNDGVSSNNIALVRNATPYTTWATGFGLDPGTDGAPDFDKDGDGQNNLLEFALGGSPISGSNNARIFNLVADGDVDGDATHELLMTIAVRLGTPAFTGSPSPGATLDGVTYSIQGSSTLGNFPSTVTPVGQVLPPAPNNVPPAGYEYRTFSLDGSNGLPDKGFLRVKVSP
jgi:autotransporter-associated beta strand protein